MADAPPPAPTLPDDDPAGTALASLLQRFAARLLDTAIVTLLTALSLSVLSGLFHLPRLLSDGAWLAVMFTHFPLVFFLYEGALLARDGQTPGKKAVGVRVACYEDGSPPGNRSWLRAAVYALPGVFACLGYLFWFVNALTCTWDRPYRQCLHDKSARTVVVTS